MARNISTAWARVAREVGHRQIPRTIGDDEARIGRWFALGASVLFVVLAVLHVASE